MKSLLTGLCLAFAVSASPQAAYDFKKILVPTDKPVLHRKDVERVKVYMWERGVVKMNAWPGDRVKLPPDANLLHVRIFPFANAMIREVEYAKGDHAPGISKEDVAAYLISGHMIHSANGHDYDERPGDASFHTGGLVDMKVSLETATLVTFIFPIAGAPPVEPVWLSGKDVPLTPVAAWVRDGKQIVARGDDVATAPPDAVRYTARVFAFPRYSITEAHVPKGAASRTRIDAQDGYVYILKGRLGVHIGDVNDRAGPGDVIHEVAGAPLHFEALEDTVFLKVSAPPSSKPASP